MKTSDYLKQITVRYLLLKINFFQARLNHLTRDDVRNFSHWKNACKFEEEIKDIEEEMKLILEKK